MPTTSLGTETQGEFVVESHTARNAADLALVRLLVNAKLLPTGTEIPAGSHGVIRSAALLGLLDEQAALRLVAERTGLQLWELNDHALQTATALLEDQRIKKVELAKWQTWCCAPVRLAGEDRVVIATANPLDVNCVKTIEFALGLKAHLELASEDVISQLLNKQLNISSAFKLENILVSSGQPGMGGALDRPAAMEQSVGDDRPDSAPVVRLVNKILAESVSRGASDIHIEPQANDLEVRIRVNGIMEPLLTVPLAYATPVASRIKLLCGLDISERRKPQDGRLRIKTPLGPRDLRLSTVPTAYGESLVARVLSGDSVALTFEKLGMPEELRRRFERALKSSSRVVLVTGPTGSGKTSSLYAGLQSLANGERNIVTIEDPIEYRINGINQIQINPKVGLTFAEGLRSIVRQDPDVVMVGEIRDTETAQIAMQTAQTGHLVLSTLHTNSAAAAVTRLKDLGAPSYLIASSVGAVVGQRLVRTLCECAKPVADDVKLQLEALSIDSTNAKEPCGCDACNHSGYRGRTGIYSFLEVTPEISEAIRADKGESEIERLAKLNGFNTLADSARELLALGKTSLEEVERVLGPLDPVSASVHPQEKSVDAPRSSGKRRVLLVEDDENTRAILTMLLEKEFYEVIGAGNGVEGLEQLHERKPDIVVCDLMMPQMNGLQMLKKVRNDSRTKSVPVLMLTAANTEENELKLIEDGANDFVSKTADSRILVARIERLLSDL
jgi:type II secretory ATPase GspE/PulE/Tfp pilus assembly ATPase PilB-like protein/ActR/RegA family two-component response regulator